MRLEGPSGGPAEFARPCDHAGCLQAGEYRAPKSPQHLTDYYWFCLDHVRDYNKSWNYYEGMDDAEIEAHIRADTVWQRPTWRLGSWGAAGVAAASVLRDHFGFFTGDDGIERAAARPRPAKPPTETEEALAVLELSPPVTLAEIKVRYKGLVKRLHPDANGGDKAAEEHLKLINQAYSTLKNSAWF